MKTISKVQILHLSSTIFLIVSLGAVFFVTSLKAEKRVIELFGLLLSASLIYEGFVISYTKKFISRPRRELVSLESPLHFIFGGFAILLGISLIIILLS